jgi:hypothetical protein
MSINSDSPFLEYSKISMSEISRSFMWILPCLTVRGLVTEVCYTDVIQTFWVWAFRRIYEYYFPQNISTIKYLPLAARYNWYQGPVSGRGPAVEKHWLSGLLGLRVWVRNISSSLGFEIRTVHPVASHYNERKHIRDMPRSEFEDDNSMKEHIAQKKSRYVGK